MWTQDISIGYLHYIRSKFSEQQGHLGINLPLFNKATEKFYNSKQFAVNGDNFITWGYLEDEENYLQGKFDWLEDISKGELWLFEADMKGLVRSALRQLSDFTQHKQAKFFTSGRVRILALRKE
jgi:hypothetical protein